MDTKTAVLMAKYAFYSPRTLSRYANARRTQQASADELLSISWSKRRRLIQHAFDTVPYYGTRFRNIGLDPGDLRQPEDWAKVPLLSKEDIRQNFDLLRSSTVGSRNVRVSSTGGSTGTPLKVLHDLRFPLEILIWRMLSWWDVGAGEDGVYAWRLTRTSTISRLMNTALWWPTKRVRFDASSMSPAESRRFVQKLNDVRPAVLQGYAGAVDYLAAYVEENLLSAWSPRAVWVTSSAVSSIQRARIERVFRAPVYDQYGCAEVHSLAAQCSQRRNLHIMADYRHIEVVDDSDSLLAQGIPGELIITDLENWAFPIIRYKNGDRGCLVGGSCDCGVTLPLMESVLGRVTDMIRLPDGTQLAGDFLTTIFDDYPDEIGAFQVRQLADYSLKILVVPTPRGSSVDAVVETVRKVLVNKTRGQVPVTTKVVADIQSDRGKLRYVVSEVERGAS